ncbi:MAG: hypothetical protein LBH98_09065 [Chitinispirillales bacterium]|jgi:hypothetical protein|nr:hypothetical protein [Chitinispirillales bacterium]
MKILYILFVFIFLSGCVGYTEFPPYNSYPDDFVKLIKIDSRIIDVKKEQINTKEELMTYIHTTKRDGTFDDDAKEWQYIYHRSYLYFSMSNADASAYKYVVYIKPLSQNKPVLDTNLYYLGMPISTDLDQDDYIGTTMAGLNAYISSQRVVLIKGKPEYWADSSYEHRGNKFTILPVCDSDETEIAELRFTYTVKKVVKDY